jgi:hypothetical protein
MARIFLLYEAKNVHRKSIFFCMRPCEGRHGEKSLNWQRTFLNPYRNIRKNIERQWFSPGPNKE